ncbi:hypothetical protein RHSIM_Rhsim12G0102100 [Rhododendron simsii]|uniref:Uncharacterized protein n=1 Tax=Rhododendron simsii TaxID=118357 RepID=A0A834GAI0_RHOSS|nr:hypothetical protein RHSIM_Rhsim12G0102100 [Rhododendron simsii]
MTILTRIVTSRMEFLELLNPFFEVLMTMFQTMQFRVGCLLQLDILKPIAMWRCPMRGGMPWQLKVDSVLQGEFAGYPVGVCDGNGPRLAKLDGGVGL